MDMGKRIENLEQADMPPEPPLKFRLCTAPPELSPTKHLQLHGAQGEVCFTLNLGDCSLTPTEKDR